MKRTLTGNMPTQYHGEADPRNYARQEVKPPLEMKDGEVYQFTLTRQMVQDPNAEVVAIDPTKEPPKEDARLIPYPRS